MNNIIMGKNIRYNIKSNSSLIMEPITVVAAIIIINVITGRRTAMNM